MELWVDTAKRALDRQFSDDVELIKSRRPPVFDVDGIQGATAPLLAACAWMGAFFREAIAGHPLDFWALLLRLLALALTVRAALLGWILFNRIRGWFNTPRYGLALTNQGLLLRTPSGDQALSREEIVAFRDCFRQSERAGRRWRDLYAVTGPQTGRLFVSIAPFFGASASVLAARLSRWLGPAAPAASSPFPDPEQHADTLFRQVNRGERPEGVAVIAPGRAWLKRGPYASILLGFAVLDGFIRIKPLTKAAIGPTVPIAIALCLVAVPLVWFAVVRRRLGPQSRAALLMTPAELLVSFPSGIERLRWRQLLRIEITSKNLWSMFEGMYESRSLVFYGEQEFVMTIDEAFLGAPAEVIVALAEAYRSGVLPKNLGSGAA
jgi:hypothetical protein